MPWCQYRSLVLALRWMLQPRATIVRTTCVGCLWGMGLAATPGLALTGLQGPDGILAITGSRTGEALGAAVLLLLSAAEVVADAAPLDLGDLEAERPLFVTGEGLAMPDLAALSSLFLLVRHRSWSTSFHRFPSLFLQFLQHLNLVGWVPRSGAALAQIQLSSHFWQTSAHIRLRDFCSLTTSLSKAWGRMSPWPML